MGEVDLVWVSQGYTKDGKGAQSSAYDGSQTKSVGKFRKSYTTFGQSIFPFLYFNYTALKT